MSIRLNELGYRSYAEFYRHTYGQSIVQTVEFARGALLESAQSAGDWSDAATPDLSFAWLARGDARLSCDLGAGRFKQTMRRGDVVLTSPGAGSFLEIADPHLVRILAVPYQSLIALANSNDLPSDGSFGRLHAGLLREPNLIRLLEMLWAEAVGSEPHCALSTDGLLLQIAAVLLRSRDRTDVVVARGGLAPWQVKRAAEYMADRLAEDVSLDDLSRLLGLSTFHLCRAFKQSTGLPPHRWRHQRRIERARELLEETELPITEVAAAVGYDDPSQLAAAFRKALGVSPSQYRRERRS
ncbi:MAG: helix-turn-helix domain-containing protein [Allosphingosinicella sp.]|uniref:helix-turn-helix domain-containing protein n=1 Tax=Allosphingosinicella sp. TaxID=2823234 RepID=UPI0039461378